MHLVYDVDLELSILRRIPDRIDKVPDIFYRVIGSRIEFENIQGIDFSFFFEAFSIGSSGNFFTVR